jgi:predicted thioesterase
MKPRFEAGITRQINVKVTEDMCPAFGGVVIHRCYSTWSLVHHMEIAARAVLVEYLEPDEEAVGSHVSVDHLAPCTIGKTVRLEAELVEVSGRNVVCDIAAYDGDRLLGKGRHVQTVMQKEALKRHLERG